MLYRSIIESPLGDLYVESDGEALLGLWPQSGKYNPLFGKALEGERLPVIEETKHWLKLYFEGGRPDFMPKLSPQGTSFQKLIWQLLQEIPYGETTTYGAIALEAAKRMGKKSMSPQAVGGAVGHNPIMILIPCHRVLGANGALTGFSAGLEKKKYLLQIENIAWKDR